MSSPTSLRVRVWTDEGALRAPEQRAGILRRSLPRTAVCFSGGGTRSMVATLGQLRALTMLGLLDQVGYLSCVSGSAWAVTPFVYGADGVDRLGRGTRPEQLTCADLARLDSASLLVPATSRFREILASFGTKGTVSPDRAWCRAVGQTFLGPFGLETPEVPLGFGPPPEALGEAMTSQCQVPCRRPRAIQPFPVVHATLNWPEIRSEQQHHVPFEYTPLAVGAPQVRELSYEGHTRIVGGSYIEPMGFGGEPLEPMQVSGLVRMLPPLQPFTLGDMIGTSSAFNTADRNVQAYPHARYWTPSASTRGPQVVNDLFTDGGDVDTMSLLGMLRRKLSVIVVFLNSVWPLAMDYDPDVWPVPGQIDPAVPCLFGQPSRRWPHNHVFPQAAYRDLVRMWQRAKGDGRPLVASMRLPVESNDWWGIEGGWEVSICWVYNDRVGDWESMLKRDVRQLLLGRSGDSGEGSLARFPHYRTIGENPGALTRLTTAQANLLSELAGWGVLESEATLRDVFSQA